tara:strand:+ start:3216 stop:3476 length:261 start_codon:yes stop_codon:yes gene_type:complete
MYEMSSVGNFKDVSTIQEYIELFTKHIRLSKFDFFKNRLQIHSDLTKCTKLLDKINKNWQNQYNHEEFVEINTLYKLILKKLHNII